MLPPPCAHPLHMDLTAEISRVLPAPLPLTRQLAGLLAFRLRAELLVVAVPRMRPEPIPTVTTLSLSLRAHRLLPKENREEYDNHGLLPNRFTQIDATAADRPREQKKEEDDPFGSREEKKNTNLSDRLKKNHFKPAFTANVGLHVEFRPATAVAHVSDFADNRPLKADA